MESIPSLVNSIDFQRLEIIENHTKGNLEVINIMEMVFRLYIVTGR